MTRRLRPALDIVSDIGALGFDLQHHSDEKIADAVKLLRTVNPEMLDFLSRILSSEPVSALKPITAGDIRTGLLDTFEIDKADIFYRVEKR